MSDKTKTAGQNYRDLLAAANAAREEFMAERAENMTWYVEPGNRFAVAAIVTDKGQVELHGYRPLKVGVEKKTKSDVTIGGVTFKPMGRFSTYLYADTAAAYFTSGSSEFVREFINENAGKLKWKHNI
jgi:hypothetical protein